MFSKLNSDFRIKTYKSPSDLGLQVGSNLHIADVFQAMPYNSIFQCKCEGENTFSSSDYPVSPNGSPIGYGILTINKGEGNRNSITFSQSLSAGTHDLWINSCTYTGDESTLGSWDKAVTNADLLLLSGADQAQFDTVDQNVYFKIVRDGVVYQLSADPTGIHYDKFENDTWTNIWHMLK